MVVGIGSRVEEGTEPQFVQPGCTATPAKSQVGPDGPFSVEQPVEKRHIASLDGRLRRVHMQQRLQELQLGDCHEINPFDGHQHAPAGGERKASQTDGESGWVDPQRHECAPDGGRLAPIGLWIHRLSRFACGPANVPAKARSPLGKVMLRVHTCKKNVSAVGTTRIHGFVH
jgi:hypothetical protein